MPAKATSKQARSIQYLLSADRKLRRLTLKRISTPVAIARIQHRSAGSQAVRRLKTVASVSPISRSFVLAMIGIIAAGALIAAYQPARRTDEAAAPPAAASPQTDAIVAPRGSMTKPPVVPKPSATTGEIRKTAAEPAAIVHAAATPGAPDPAVPRKPEHESTKKVLSDATRAAAPEPVPTTARADSTPMTESKPDTSLPVTISGCLQLDDAKFRLKDTDGNAAPKVRSWKSAFLRKRASPIGLVDATNTLQLATHVGHRVSATGTLVDGELRARSLQKLSPSCR